MIEVCFQSDGTLVEYAEDEVVRLYCDERQEILDWCLENNISADLLWAGWAADDCKSRWGIKNEQNRMFFTLRWT